MRTPVPPSTSGTFVAVCHAVRHEMGRATGRCLLLAVLIVAGQLLALEWLLHPETVTGISPDRLVCDDGDYRTEAAVKSLNNSLESGEQIVFFGGSSCREGNETDEEMSRLLEEYTGRPVHCLTLATPGQSLSETLALAANLRQGPQTLVVIGVNPHRLCHTEVNGDEEAEVRIPFLSPAAESWLGELGCESAPWQPAAVRERTFIYRYLERRVVVPLAEEYGLKRPGKTGGTNGSPMQPLQFNLGGPLQIVRHRYPDTGLDPDQKARLIYQVSEDRTPAFRSGIDTSMQFLEQMILQLRSGGTRVVLWESPRSEDSFRAYAAIEALYQDKLRDLSERLDVPVVFFPRGPLNEPSLFYDLDHFLPAGRKAHLDWLVPQLAELQSSRTSSPSPQLAKDPSWNNRNSMPSGN